jgi:hypothetical protein
MKRNILSFTFFLSCLYSVAQTNTNNNIHVTSLGDVRSEKTTVVDVLNPATGKIWMDRNLGASRAATSSADAEAYGDLYQWGRAADGHQKSNSLKTYTTDSSNQPKHQPAGKTCSGFEGFDTYTIDSVRTDDQGRFELSFSEKDYGMGYLAAEDDRPFIVILACW